MGTGIDLHFIHYTLSLFSTSNLMTDLYAACLIFSCLLPALKFKLYAQHLFAVWHCGSYKLEWTRGLQKCLFFDAFPDPQTMSYNQQTQAACSSASQVTTATVTGNRKPQLQPNWRVPNTLAQYRLVQQQNTERQNDTTSELRSQQQNDLPSYSASGLSAPPNHSSDYCHGLCKYIINRTLVEHSDRVFGYLDSYGKLVERLMQTPNTEDVQARREIREVLESLKRSHKEDSLSLKETVLTLGNAIAEQGRVFEARELMLSNSIQQAQMRERKLIERFDALESVVMHADNSKQDAIMTSVKDILMKNQGRMEQMLSEFSDSHFSNLRTIMTDGFDQVQSQQQSLGSTMDNLVASTIERFDRVELLNARVAELVLAHREEIHCDRAAFVSGLQSHEAKLDNIILEAKGMSDFKALFVKFTNGRAAKMPLFYDTNVGDSGVCLQRSLTKSADWGQRCRYL